MLTTVNNRKDAKDALSEVLICGMRMNDSVSHPHSPHTQAPRNAAQSSAQVPCATEQPQQHDDMTASFSFLAQGSTTYN